MQRKAPKPNAKQKARQTPAPGTTPTDAACTAPTITAPATTYAHGAPPRSLPTSCNKRSAAAFHVRMEHKHEHEPAIKAGGVGEGLAVLCASGWIYASGALLNLAQNEGVKHAMLIYINQTESLKELIQANYSDLYDALFSE